MSQIKLSDIKAVRQGHEIDDLFDLVKRLGKLIDGLVFRYHCDHHGDLEDCHFHKCKEACALLKELKL